MKDVQRDYKSFFNKHGEDANLFFVESALWLASHCHPKPPLDEVWTLLQGYIVYDKRKQSIFFETKRRMVSLACKGLFSSEKGWKEAVQAYRNVNPAYRLFSFEEDHYNVQRPAYEPPEFADVKRTYVYHKHYTNDVHRRETEKIAISAGKYRYFSKPKDGIWIGEVPSYTIETIPSYQKKHIFSMDISTGKRKATAENMFQQTNNSKWREQAERTCFSTGKKQKTSIPIYPTIHHITGGVGVGKNSFIEETLYRLYVEEKKEMISCVVMNTVARALELKETLLQLGLDSVVISGISSRDRHEKRKAHEILKGANSIGDVLSKLSILEDVGEECIVQKLEGDSHPKHQLPCKNRNASFRDNAENIVPCPYVGLCLRMKAFREMGQKQIWITTPHAFIDTKLPSFFDESRRTIQQVVHDVASLVFIDEVDEAMSVYDGKSLQEAFITGNKENLLPSLMSKSDAEINENQGLLRNNAISKWKQILNSLTTISDNLTGFIHRNPIFMEPYRRSSFTLSYLAINLPSYFSWDDQKEENAAIPLLFHHFSFSSKENIQSENMKKMDKLIGRSIQFFRSRLIDEDEKESLMNDWIHFLPLSLKKMRRNHPEIPVSKLLICHIELLFTLYDFEKNLQELVRLYPQISSKLNLRDENIYSLFRIQTPLFQYIEAAPTGVHFGYRLKITKKDNKPEHYELVLMRYEGILRNILVNWHDYMDTLKIGKGKQQGPCLVYLSGTSFAPNSPHNHVDVRCHWKLQRTTANPKIQVFTSYLPGKTDETNHYVSGTGTKRNENLQVLAESYIHHIIPNEIAYWKSQNQPRKVLLVVNSYDDVHLVGKYLKLRPEWQGKYRLLVREDEENGVGNDFITRHEIEDVPFDDIDLLVVPLIVLSRGYNILLPESNQSYFGTACLLIRPYYVPGDMKNYYTLMHYDMNKKVRELNNSQLHFNDYIKRLHKEANTNILGYQRMLMTMKNLNQHVESLEQLGWYTLITVMQLTGRMLRGDTSCRLILGDGKFSDAMPGDRSLLRVWQDLLSQNEKHHLWQNLYGPFIDAFQQVKEYESE